MNPLLFSALALLGLCAAAAQAAPQKTVVAHAGHWDLLQESIDDAIQAADILAGAAMSPADEAAIRNDLIAQFRQDPDKQVALYKVVVSLVVTVRGEVDRGRNWPASVTTTIPQHSHPIPPSSRHRCSTGLS
jgi:hypothetical protein